MERKSNRLNKHVIHLPQDILVYIHQLCDYNTRRILEKACGWEHLAHRIQSLNAFEKEDKNLPLIKKARLLPEAENAEVNKFRTEMGFSHRFVGASLKISDLKEYELSIFVHNTWTLDYRRGKTRWKHQKTPLTKHHWEMESVHFWEYEMVAGNPEPAMMIHKSGQIHNCHMTYVYDWDKDSFSLSEEIASADTWPPHVPVLRTLTINRQHRFVFS